MQALLGKLLLPYLHFPLTQAIYISTGLSQVPWPMTIMDQSVQVGGSMPLLSLPLQGPGAWDWVCGSGNEVR